MLKSKRDCCKNKINLENNYKGKIVSVMKNKLERNHKHINITDNTFKQIENEKEERFKIHK